TPTSNFDKVPPRLPPPVNALRAQTVAAPREIGDIVRGNEALLTQAETTDETVVPIRITLSQILQQAVALPDQLQQAASRRAVLLMGLDCLGQLGDPLGQQGDLNLGRPGVVVVKPIAFDQLLPFSVRDRHILNQLQTDEAAPAGLQRLPLPPSL